MNKPVAWDTWIRRFDRMQERYLARREERFAVIVSVLRASQANPRQILDLGCGTGTLTRAILEAFPTCTVTGIDLDKSLLSLAEARLQPFGERAKLVFADLRSDFWSAGLESHYDAGVSATALHWLSSANLARLYGKLASVLRPGAVFINADHVAAGEASVQKSWEEQRAAFRNALPVEGADSWDGFFAEYASAINADPATVGENAVTPWEGVEEGMPLVWHFDQLRDTGFVAPECFWRCDCDAIYGAFRPRKGHD